MSEQIREQVSAFLDGELPNPETELLLKRLTRDGVLRESFGRYALIGEAIRGSGRDLLTRDFAGRVNLAIDGEPAVAASGQARESRAPRWWRPFAGAAVAAGVAAVAVLAAARSRRRCARSRAVTAQNLVPAPRLRSLFRTTATSTRCLREDTGSVTICSDAQPVLSGLDRRGVLADLRSGLINQSAGGKSGRARCTDRGCVTGQWLIPCGCGSLLARCRGNRGRGRPRMAAEMNQTLSAQLRQHVLSSSEGRVGICVTLRCRRTHVTGAAVLGGSGATFGARSAGTDLICPTSTPC